MKKGESCVKRVSYLCKWGPAMRVGRLVPCGAGKEGRCVPALRRATASSHRYFTLSSQRWGCVACAWHAVALPSNMYIFLKILVP